MSKPLVSICCITYNHEAYIDEAIESFLAQKCNFEYEIIIGEDKSTDGTLDIIESYKSRFPNKIKIISSDNNVGMMNNFLRVLDAAQGKYIALCEGDDYWLNPYKLHNQVQIMESDLNISLLTHDSLKIDAVTKEELGRIRPFSATGKVDMNDFLLKFGGVLPFASMFFRKESIQNGYPKFLVDAPMGDLPFTLWMGTLGEVFYLDEVWSVYRVNVPASWMTIRKKGLSLEQKIIDINKNIYMYSEYDLFSKNKYNITLDYIIKDFQLRQLCLQKNYKKLFQKRSIYGYKKIIKKYIYCNFEFLVKSIRILKNVIRLKTNI